jgi:hypothetical protein
MDMLLLLFLADDVNVDDDGGCFPVEEVSTPKLLLVNLSFVFCCCCCSCIWLSLSLSTRPPASLLRGGMYNGDEERSHVVEAGGGGSVGVGNGMVVATAAVAAAEGAAVADVISAAAASKVFLSVSCGWTISVYVSTTRRKKNARLLLLYDQVST